VKTALPVVRAVKCALNDWCSFTSAGDATTSKLTIGSAVHLPFVQPAPGLRPPPAQHASPIAPQATQLVPLHTLPVAHVLPPQHAWPAPPHRQVPLWQVRLAEQALFAQQV
jgi:hypothetical protein